jgi:hypothetical protein
MIGNIKKMLVQHESPVQYQLPVGDELLDMNALIGKRLSLHYEDEIHCVACGRKTSKSFAQGHCYPCFRELASCDMCIMKPETCHFDAGTCREPDWAMSHCMQPHTVYLAISSGVKVGITRGTQVPTRWIDQGASYALPIYQVKTRLQSGLVEVAIAKFVSDKTSWQRMLKGPPEQVDLDAKRDELFELADEELGELHRRFDEGALRPVFDADLYEFEYPIEQYPEKVKSFNFDKTADVEGVLMGIKGQYLILDSGVLNMRKFTGYKISVESA